MKEILSASEKEKKNAAWVVQHRQGVPRQSVQSPSTEIFQPWPDKVLSSLLWLSLLEQGWDWMVPKGAQQPQQCSCCDSVP